MFRSKRDATSGNARGGNNPAHVNSAGSMLTDAADAGDGIAVTVLLRRRETPATFSFDEYIDARSPKSRNYLSRETFVSTLGADPDDIDKITAFASEHDLSIGRVNLAARTVQLYGPTSAIEAAFGIELQDVDGRRNETYVDFHGQLSVPAELDAIIVWVFGLRKRSVAWRSVKVRDGSGSEAPEPGIYSPVDVANAYQFPEEFDGSGECIGLIELPGGYQIEDIAEALENYGIENPPEVVLAYGKNNPGSDVMDDIEATMDIEIAAAVAPGAKIAVYFAEGNNAHALYEAISHAIHDREHKPTVLSLSLTGPEPLFNRPENAPVLFDLWKKKEIHLMNELFLDAAVLGITICCSSGDNGSQYPHGDDPFSSYPVANFPASSPYVLSCGGTTLNLDDNEISDESVWNSLGEVLWISFGDGPPMAAGGGASSGGISSCAPLPAYQKAAEVPLAAAVELRDGKLQTPSRFQGRGIPDVSANADLNTGFRIRYSNNWITGGGTSAASPLWAGLAARLNHGLGTQVGFMNAYLYRFQIDEQKTVLRDIDNGTNGAYQARKGWDACTGLGSPNGVRILDALRHLE